MNNEQQTIWGYKITVQDAIEIIPKKDKIHVFDEVDKISHTVTRTALIAWIYESIRKKESLFIPNIKIDTLHGIKYNQFYIETDRKKLNQLI